MPPIRQPRLDAAFARAREDSVEFPFMLANHAPMVLIALDRLGAPARAVEKWYETYHALHNLPPFTDFVGPIDQGTWRGSLGDRTREADYRHFFAGEVVRVGAVGAIRAYLPHLIQGVAGSATHPLMRLAYGIIAEDDNEIAVALGYWASCYLPLPEPTGAEPDTDDPAEVLAGIASIDGVLSTKPETDLLWHSIRAVGALPKFRPVVDRLAIGADTPRRMAETALALYLSTMNFAALHAVTGLHWVRVVGSCLDDSEPLYRAFWQVVAALVPEIGFPSLPSAEEIAAMRDRPAPPWSAIKRAAIGSDDEHDISLTFSCLQEEETWSDPLYRLAAARRLGLTA
jgi:hypothetical protein